MGYKDSHKAFRNAVFEALDGNLVDESSSPVNVYDGKAEDDTNNIYVLLDTETGSQEPLFSGFLTESSILLKIINKQQDTISKDSLDNVSEQITNILFPAPVIDGLVQQDGFQINCLRVESVNASEVKITNARTENAKYLRLTAAIAQN